MTWQEDSSTSVTIGLAEARQPRSGTLSLNKRWYAGGNKREDAVRILHGRTAQQNTEKQSPNRLKTMSVKPATFSNVRDEWLHWNDPRIEPSTLRNYQASLKPYTDQWGTTVRRVGYCGDIKSMIN